MYNRDNIMIVDIIDVEISAKISTLTYPEFLKKLKKKNVFDIYVVIVPLDAQKTS